MMRDRRVMKVLAVSVAAALCLVAGAAGHADASGHAYAAAGGPIRGGWLTVRPTGNIGFEHISCVRGAAGLCTALGMNQSGTNEPVVVAAVKAGVWGPAKQIPGLAALAPASGQGVISADAISCPAAGDCLIAGLYGDAAMHAQGYLAEEVKGSWHKAAPVPGLIKLNTGGVADIGAASCASPGNCVITGSYTPGKPASLNFASQVFVASEVGYVWHAAITLPGIVKLNAGDSAVGLEISCPAPGYCALGGNYENSATYMRPFLDSEVNGTWGAATAVPGNPVTTGNYSIDAVSCAKPGACVAVGNDFSGGHDGSYAVTQHGAGWSRAVALSGLGAATALSCPAAGACVVAGSTAGTGLGYASIVAESGGHWGKSAIVPGAKAYAYKGKAANSEVSDLTCPATGYCLIGGDFIGNLTNSSVYTRGFVASETAGTWGTAAVLPGLARLDTAVYSGVAQVACAAPATCVAIGSYAPPAQYDGEGFVTAELPLQPTSAALHLSQTRVTLGKEQAATLSVTVTAHGSTPGAIPVGTATVRTGTTTICVIKLAAGAGAAKGSCTLKPSQLRAGTYRVAADYPGNGPFQSSASPATTLTVT